MNVSQLIEKLKTLDPNLEVLLSRDQEGNRFHFLDKDIETYLYSKAEGHPIHPDDLDEYEQNELERVVIIWPEC